MGEQQPYIKVKKPDWKGKSNFWFHHQMVALINSMGRELVNERECKGKQYGGNKTSLISILKLSKLHFYYISQPKKAKHSKR